MGEYTHGSNHKNKCSHVLLLTTLCTVAPQAPVFMAFSSQRYWSGLPYFPPGDLPDPGIKPVSLRSPALAGGSLSLAPPGKPKKVFINYLFYYLFALLGLSCVMRYLQSLVLSCELVYYTSFNTISLQRKCNIRFRNYDFFCFCFVCVCVRL